MLSDVEKNCEECGNRIIGRVDKRFCSGQCRATFNNRLNHDVNGYIRNTNNTLRKNRRILIELNPRGKSKATRSELLAKGFDFSHITSISTTKDGAQYYFCYEQGYVPVEKDGFLLVRMKKNQNRT